MIIAIDGVLKIDGSKRDVMAEATQLMHGLYEIMVEKEGEEAAEEQLRILFQLAKMSSDEVAEATEEIQRMDEEAALLEQEPPRFLS